MLITNLNGSHELELKGTNSGKRTQSSFKLFGKFFLVLSTKVFCCSCPMGRTSGNKSLIKIEHSLPVSGELDSMGIVFLCFFCGFVWRRRLECFNEERVSFKGQLKHSSNVLIENCRTNFQTKFSYVRFLQTSTSTRSFNYWLPAGSKAMYALLLPWGNPKEHRSICIPLLFRESSRNQTSKIAILRCLNAFPGVELAKKSTELMLCWRRRWNSSFTGCGIPYRRRCWIDTANQSTRVEKSGWTRIINVKQKHHLSPCGYMGN